MTQKTMSEGEVAYKGWLQKGVEPGVVYGEIKDKFGWVIGIRGVYDPATRSYVLEGRLGETPPALRIAGLDTEAAK